MLAQQRQALILETVRESGAARVADLVLRFGVSDMTIRRDLDALARRGLLDKVHGGATVPQAGSTDEPGFAEKSRREPVEKRGIARAAAQLVRPGQAIGLSAGTTTWTLAHELLDVPGLTVVTNSPPVAEVLHEQGRADQTVVLTGGVRTPSDALVGPVAVGSLASINLDTVFLGTHGMDVRAGFSTPNFLEAETNRALIRAARRLVVVADHTKWGVVGIATIAPLDQADVLVSDPGLSRDARQHLSEHVDELVVAAPDGTETR
ncbi:DeoR/GlpR family DNA-binding transcription regulator [Nocardioides mesophilus]|uniref:DeoR/GlpR transcriptional regulator n=1 Tax=Nocardioides mesophilus TaxID=433659 RepID=A0A7G9RDF5_9ACTN|nr:DeoR/GlpR family DNA-binding transcription regulator [Nocardioides mesophilus]QNN53630.1 DeoR/GlpR transcriptional regulator [Nocardioides mesophilus]